jgi:hypothetical protein
LVNFLGYGMLLMYQLTQNNRDEDNKTLFILVVTIKVSKSLVV